MQRFKPLFQDLEHTGTIANIQTCLRIGDLDEVGDATHYLSFHMIGLFSFRSLSLQDAIDFWMGFCGRVGLWPDHVTIHPEKLDAWAPLYRGRVPIVTDPDCVWSDGAISGYCTEFYRDGVEIGNIVNPLGTCIDCGFGLERMAGLISGAPTPDRLEILRDAVGRTITAGYRPGPKEQEYVLRKLLRLLHREGGHLEHPFMADEIGRLERSQERYRRLLEKHRDKDASWWWDTHGIVLAEVS